MVEYCNPENVLQNHVMLLNFNNHVLSDIFKRLWIKINFSSFEFQSDFKRIHRPVYISLRTDQTESISIYIIYTAATEP